MNMETAITPKMTGAMNAALLVLLMEEQDASAILGQMTPEEVETLGRHMCELGEVASEEIQAALINFVDTMDNSSFPDEDRSAKVMSLISNAVGPVRADSVMRRITPDRQGDTTSMLDLARWLEPEIILMMIQDELPHTIAVLLVNLDPMVAATILSRLPDDQQPEIVQRIATLRPVNALAMTLLEEMLESRISERFGAIKLKVGGVQDAANIINNAGKAIEKHVMPKIGKQDKKLAKALENELFKFEHLFVLDAKMMGQLLREVDNEILIDALKGIAEDEREVFFAAMSSRAVDGLKDEIEGRGRLKMTEVEAAQKEVIEIARRLAADGTIILGEGDDDYV